MQPYLVQPYLPLSSLPYLALRPANPRVQAACGCWAVQRT